MNSLLKLHTYMHAKKKKNLFLKAYLLCKTWLCMAKCFIFYLFSCDVLAVSQNLALLKCGSIIYLIYSSFCPIQCTLVLNTHFYQKRNWTLWKHQNHQKYNAYIFLQFNTMLYEAILPFVCSGPGSFLFHLIPTSACNKINREYLLHTNMCNLILGFE